MNFRFNRLNAAALAVCTASLMALPLTAVAQTAPAAPAAAAVSSPSAQPIQAGDAAKFTLPQPDKPLGLRMEGYDYPYPVSYFDLTLENRKLQMAYMDVKPTATANGQTVVLLHGGLGFGAYWRETIAVLAGAGYRVVVPDQLGFGKSSKDAVRYSFHQYAKNTRALLDSLGISRSVILGHSMGGLLAARYALMYPEAVSKLVMENPLGLEDYRLSIPYKSIDELREGYQKATWESTQRLHASTYAKWEPKYSENAQVLYRMTLGPDAPVLALAQAYIQQIMYTEPVVYELKNITAPTLMTWGEFDSTVPGKGYAKPEVRKTLGNFAELTRKAAAVMPHVQVQRLAGVAHVPHLEDPATFHKLVLDFLAKP